MYRIDSMEDIMERIRSRLDAIDRARESALIASRKITRNSGDSIKAIHREEWDSAEKLIEDTGVLVTEVNVILKKFPEIYYAGFVADAQTEFAEVSILYAALKNKPLPGPDELSVDYTAYLNGVGDCIGELRRHILDLIRKGRAEEGEKYLSLMDEFFTQMITFDYPDAITRGLRKKTDAARSVIERTRGDLTNALQVKDLKVSMEKMGKKLG
jgi:translin